MSRRALVTLILSIFLLASGRLSAGNLAPELSDIINDKIKAAASDEMIPVWIHLRSQSSRSDFKTAVTASSSSLQAQHSFAMKQLREENSRSQEALLNELSALRNSRLARDIKGYWIANVIAVSVSASELTRIAGRADVVTIYAVPKIEIIEPILVSPASPAAGGIESNLTYINAPAAWNMGFTGQGRLVCSFDSGVDGAHRALNGSWRGNNGDSAAAWFDPLFGQAAPHVLSGSSAPSHGTWTTGVLVGHDPVSGETTGVALDAEWIATYVTDLPGASLFDAFQWAADPDRNPNTFSDVPDVINHSWGFVETFSSCVNLLYDLIDNSEALGIVNIFAAGNAGLGGIQNPADGAKNSTDSLSSFAVGGINHRTDTVSLVPSSSRGPSICFGAIKPNVVAPGESIMAPNPGGTPYAFLTGTSLAAPHVSGLVALLRQKNPNASVDEIKQAILSSANGANFGPVPNNDVGWGEIDCVAALNALSGSNSDPNVRLYNFTHAPIQAGDTVRGVVTLQNLGLGASNVSLTVTGNDPDLLPLSTSAFFGSIAEGQIVISNDTIVAVVGNNVVNGTRLKLFITISGDGFNTATSLYFQVGSVVPKSKVNHNTGRIAVTVTNYGVIGLGPNSLYPAKGIGFNFDNLGDYLWEGGLMIGTGFSAVSSGVHATLDEPEPGFKPAAGGDLDFTSPGVSAFEETTSKFNDEYASSPLGLEITQQTFAREAPDDDFVLLRYVIENTTASTVSNLYVGMFLDWDVVNFSTNAGGYDAADNFLWTARNLGGTKSRYRGVTMTEGTVTTALTDVANASTIYLPTNPGGDGFTTFEKFNTLKAGFGSASSYVDATIDLYQVMAAGPVSISPGQNYAVTFALIAGSTLVDIRNAAVRAASVLIDVETDPDDILPASFRLHQNYPNPFNPATTISFDLPRASEYTLTVFNILGESVYRQTEIAKAGRVEILWNAEHLASGIYFYRVEAGDFLASRKMILLK